MTPQPPRLVAWLLAVAALMQVGGVHGAGSGRIPLTRLSLGEIGGWIEVAVEVNGQTGRWLIDTGSTRHLVSSAFAERHGLVARSAVRADTAIGPVHGTEVALPRLKLGAFERAGQTALKVNDLRTLVGPAAEGLDGILGVPFFDGVALDMDLRNWTLEIVDSLPGVCPADTERVSLGQHRGLPVIDVRVNNGPVESLLLDTGNPAAMVRLEGGEPAASEPGLTLPGGVSLALARQVAIGALRRLDVPVLRLRAAALQRALGPSIAGLAGTALLDGARWQLDLSQRRACVEHGSLGVPGGFGLTLVQRNGALYVDAVLPGGPAQAAGLRTGDVIQRWVDGPPNSSMHELWARVQGREEIDLLVGDESRPVRLRRTYFAPRLP